MHDKFKREFNDCYLRNLFLEIYFWSNITTKLKRENHYIIIYKIKKRPTLIYNTISMNYEVDGIPFLHYKDVLDYLWKQ